MQGLLRDLYDKEMTRGSFAMHIGYEYGSNCQNDLFCVIKKVLNANNPSLQHYVLQAILKCIIQILTFV